MVNALVMLRPDYCNSLHCGLPKREIDKLQRIHNCAACLLSGIRRWDHITPVKALQWLPIHARIEILL